MQLKDVNKFGITKMVTPLALPVINETFLKKHVAAGARLYTVIDEPVFVDKEIKNTLAKTAIKMRSLLASPAQACLVVLCTIRQPQLGEVQHIWNNMGGSFFAINPQEYKEFFINQTKLSPSSGFTEYIINLIPGGIQLFRGGTEFSTDSLAIALQLLVRDDINSISNLAREALDIPEGYSVNDFSLFRKED